MSDRDLTSRMLWDAAQRVWLARREQMAAEAERDALKAERLEVRRIAVGMAFQPTDWDDGTEAEIACGRAILRAMGEPLNPGRSLPRERNPDDD